MILWKPLLWLCGQVQGCSLSRKYSSKHSVTKNKQKSDDSEALYFVIIIIMMMMMEEGEDDVKEDQIIFTRATEYKAKINQ
jgi:hypothetical protein